MTNPSGTPGEWLSLTELGRLYGISAVHTGRLLDAAGLRLPGGEPSSEAISSGLARRLHPGRRNQALWNQQACEPHLVRQGLAPRKQPNLVGLWADLLSALQQGSPWVNASAEEMAGEIPGDLVTPVNRELRLRGCSFQVRQSVRTGAAPRPACSPVPASVAADPHPYG